SLSFCVSVKGRELFMFFFSSRRRHTRFSRDWSSDVCSSDLTVLIETILAAFEIDEILYELKDYIVGQNCGRWDYIFSFIKKFREIGRASCRERAEISGAAGALKKYKESDNKPIEY